jgi:hypothetical protein
LQGCFIVISTAEITNNIYQNQYKNELYKQIQFYLDKLKSLAHQEIEEVVMYIYQDDLEQINPKVIEALKNSNEVMYLKWNLKNDIVHIFAYKESEIFHKIVSQLLERVRIEHWKILALKFLIEQYEHEYPNLFEDRDFRESYGRLLRKVYIDYMPWYFKILIYINFPFFQDVAFRIAKEKILQEQKILEEKNNQKLEEKKQQEIQEKKEKLSKAKDIDTLIRIMDKVQQYFSQGKIPFINQILLEFPGWEEKDFLEYLKKQNFVLFPIKNEKVILYPKNFNWKIYAKRLEQTISQNLNQINQNPQIEQNKLELVKIRSFIDSQQKGNNVIEPTEDPYSKLSKIISKEKQGKNIPEDLPDEIEI